MTFDSPVSRFLERLFGDGDGSESLRLGTYVAQTSKRRLESIESQGIPRKLGNAGRGAGGFRRAGTGRSAPGRAPLIALAGHGPSAVYGYGDYVRSKYRVGEFFKLKDDDGRPISTNVYLQARAPYDPAADPDEHGTYQDASIIPGALVVPSMVATIAVLQSTYRYTYLTPL